MGFKFGKKSSDIYEPDSQGAVRSNWKSYFDTKTLVIGVLAISVAGLGYGFVDQYIQNQDARKTLAEKSSALGSVKTNLEKSKAELENALAAHKVAMDDLKTGYLEQIGAFAKQAEKCDVVKKKLGIK